MDLTQAILEIRTGLSGRTVIDAQAIRSLNSVQRGLEEGLSLPDFLLAYDVAIAVTAADPNITLPTGFLRMHDDYDMYFEDVTNGRTKIKRRKDSEARDAYGAVEDSENAIVWVLRSKTTGLLIPTPTASATYYLTYYKAEPILSSGTTANKWLDFLPDVMIGAAGLELAQAAGYKEGIAFFQQRINRGERIRMGGIVDQELQGRTLVMGRNN